MAIYIVQMFNYWHLCEFQTLHGLDDFVEIIYNNNNIFDRVSENNIVKSRGRTLKLMRIRRRSCVTTYYCANENWSLCNDIAPLIHSPNE
jgi:hypothetical protein